MKRWAEGCHLIDYTTKRPDITLFIILALFYLFWTHVERGTYIGLGILGLVTNGFSESEVTKFGVLPVIQKYVRRFDAQRKISH